jgi:hypothetical protein
MKKIIVFFVLMTSLLAIDFQKNYGKEFEQSESSSSIEPFIGYEHRVNKNYIFDLSFNGTLLPLGTVDDLKRSYYACFSMKYIFDIP